MASTFEININEEVEDNKKKTQWRLLLTWTKFSIPEIFHYLNFYPPS